MNQPISLNDYKNEVLEMETAISFTGDAGEAWYSLLLIAVFISENSFLEVTILPLGHTAQWAVW